MTLYDAFEKRFDYTLKGDFKRHFEHLPDVDVYSWLRIQESKIYEQLKNTALKNFIIGFFCGSFMASLLFNVVSWLTK